MRTSLYEFYWWWQRRLVPGLEPSQYYFADALARTLGEEVHWLDMGCGRRPVPAWLPTHRAAPLMARAASSVGSDLDMDSLRDNRVVRRRVQASGAALPFRSGSFDVVSANMVMEHIADPAHVLREVRRVLREGGLFVFHTPNRRYWAIVLAALTPDAVKARFVNALEGRAAEDVFPTHYRFNDAHAITRIAADAGFEVVNIDAVSSSAVLAAAGPLGIIELCWIRLLRRPRMARWRSNFIGVLRVPVSAR